ncbi:MAG: formylmethanofuran dehydrogenase subunit A [Longimicrobiales bacterium]
MSRGEFGVTGELRITGGCVYDPAHGVDGAVRDVCVRDGRIVHSLRDDARTLDARGLVVMPGGVDIHCHIAGPKVSLARCLEPERRRADVVERRVFDADGEMVVLRSGTGGTVPSTFATGYRYAGLGYTTAFEAAVPALGARQAHQELNDTPVIDKGFYLLLGNDAFLLDRLAAGDADAVRPYVARMLSDACAYAVKVVNPGGAAAWKDGAQVTGLDDPVGRGGVTPRRIVEALADAADGLALPHPIHIHCNNLGVPGNAATTLATMRALDGRRGHFTHLQFHAYGRTPHERMTSNARELVAYIDAHAELSADVGQVMFGPATAMTADARVAELLHRVTGRRWVDMDLELASGCGVVPFEYRERNQVHALQFAIGLELFLLAKDPWRMVLSTDHPNGGSFLSYPRLIRLLMDRTFRDDQIRRLPEAAIAGTALADGLDREYTLSEIAIITRAGPARLLGLERKGHLGAGADADMAIYDPAGDAETMFSTPRYLLKGGAIVVEEGQLRRETYGATMHVAAERNAAIDSAVARYVSQHGTLDRDATRVDGDELRRASSHALRGG